MNSLSINIPANFIADCNNTLKRHALAPTDAKRWAVLNGNTVHGLWWATEFVSQLQSASMREMGLTHAIRLTHFRGAVCPEFKA